MKASESWQIDEKKTEKSRLLSVEDNIISKQYFLHARVLQRIHKYFIRAYLLPFLRAK